MANAARAHLEQRIEGPDGDDIRVHVHATQIAHQTQAQHVSIVGHFVHGQSIAVNVLRQRHLVVGFCEHEWPKTQNRTCAICISQT